jgi:hypothetical protein
MVQCDRNAVPTRQRRDHFDFHVRRQRRYTGREHSGYTVPPVTNGTANRIFDLAVNGEQDSDPFRVACGYCGKVSVENVSQRLRTRRGLA